MRFELSKRKARRLSTPAAVGGYVVAVVLAAAIVVGNVYAGKYYDLISLHLSESTQKVVSATGSTADSQYYKSDFTSDSARQTHLAQVGTQIEQEGITLLKNNGALPLSSTAKVSVFGQDSVDPVYGGGGAGSIDTSKVVNLKESLTSAGLTINPTLWDFYATGPGSKYRKTVKDAYGKGSYAVNEVPASLYTDTVKKSFSSYSDAAIVVLGRSGGESGDLPSTLDAQGHTYLQLTNDEKDMLKLATDNFKTVIVLLNTENPVELGFLNDYPISAALWVGAFGQTGATAVGEALTGKIDPSGALVDTYAYDSLSAPAMSNFGAYTIANSQVPFGNSYMVYGEGIYVGYRYYETRYEDVVLGNDSKSKYDYTKQVQFPFGYTGSYTAFKWSNYTVADKGTSYDVSVTVTNTGKVSGKDIVEIYLQSPYTAYDKSHGIEKSSVDLVGYAKTSELAAGANATVTVSVPKEDMKVYDANGSGTYVVDAGDYFLAAGQNAHVALNNILAAKGKTTADGMDANGDASFTHKITVNKLDSTTYASSQATGSSIKNEFASADIKHYDPSFTYLSRSNWEGTWPKTYQNGSWTAPQQLLDDLKLQESDNPKATAPVLSTVNAKYGTLTAASLRGVSYGNDAWSALVSQMSANDLDQLVRIGGYATKKIDSIQLPATVDKDGPAGISSTLVGGKNGMGYPPGIVLASTWNDDLAKEFGAAVGEDSLSLGTTGWYAPSMDIHRSPYSGRNFEYYSEDGVLSGDMGASVVTGAQSKGVLVTIKHFALNDQETNRMGGAVFANEEAIRELYLKPFEISVRQGDAHGVMVSMNRIGARWTGGDPHLMTDVLRNEWGFHGLAITDQASFSVFAYEDMREGLAAGTDLWLNSDASLWKLTSAQTTPTVLDNEQRAAHDIAYAIVNSNAMNGLSAASRIVSVTPLWRTGLTALDVLLGLLAAGIVFLVTRRLVIRGRSGAQSQERPEAVAVPDRTA